MYGASLRRLAPTLWAARAGWRHRRFGDPLTFVATVRARHRIVTISGALGTGGRRSNFPCERAILRHLAARGYRKERGQRRSGDGWGEARGRLVRRSAERWGRKGWG